MSNPQMAPATTLDATEEPIPQTQLAAPSVGVLSTEVLISEQEVIFSTAAGVPLLCEKISRPHRRRSGQAEQSPAAKLQQMPAVVVLERIPVPTLAIDKHGTILFANAAFAAMLGHTQDTIEQLTFHQIFLSPVDGPAVAAMRAYTDEVVELTNRNGFTVLARMSNSAMERDDDEVALVVFEDLTERLWTDGHSRRACPQSPWSST